jgi:hypothetical protein
MSHTAIVTPGELLESLEWALQLVSLRRDRMGLTRENEEKYRKAVSLLGRAKGDVALAQLEGYGEKCEGRR